MFNAHLQVSPRAASPRFAAHWIQARVLHQHDGVSPKSLVKVPHAHQAHLSVPIIVPRTIIIASTLLEHMQRKESDTRSLKLLSI
jgi:hypothetical protein